ncbi:MAG: hypothetical protein Q7K25_07965 [Actinomycetota bacterium]|nr:hypothetical protein [Actinomycetota bacterium]
MTMLDRHTAIVDRKRNGCIRCDLGFVHVLSATAAGMTTGNK